MPSFLIFGFDSRVYVFWCYSRVIDARHATFSSWSVNAKEKGSPNSHRHLTALKDEAKQIEQEVNSTKRVMCALRERKRRLDQKVNIFCVHMCVRAYARIYVCNYGFAFGSIYLSFRTVFTLILSCILN